MIVLYGAVSLAAAACASGVARTPATPAAAHSTTIGSTTIGGTAISASAKPVGTPVSTDTAACATGRCEVRVSAPETIPLTPALELTMLRVTSIKGGVVTIVTTSTFNGGNAGVDSSANVCSSNGTNATTTNDMEVGCTITNNELSMSVTSVDGDSAVLRLVPVS
jgi:hypothetical protein